MSQSSTSIPSTITRTLLLWLLSNVGGTLLLGLGFALTHQLHDCTIAVAAGLLAAIITLALVPLALPFFAVLSCFCPAYSRRSMALLGVVLFFLAANELLHLLLPFATFWGLLEMSIPYLAAALFTVFWLYSPGGKTSTAAIWPKKQNDRLLLG